jgi:hypothetical protein
MAEPQHGTCDIPRLKPTFEEFAGRALQEQAGRWLFLRFQDAGLTEAEAEELVNAALGDLAQRYHEVISPKAYFFTMLRRRTWTYLAEERREKRAGATFQERTAHERYVAQVVNAVLKILEPHLSRRERDFLELRFLSPEPLTLLELANRWSYSYAYMRQYSSAVFHKIRRILEARRQEMDTTLGEI